jgi:hypothetical protein
MQIDAPPDDVYTVLRDPSKWLLPAAQSGRLAVRGSDDSALE